MPDCFPTSHTGALLDTDSQLGVEIAAIRSKDSCSEYGIVKATGVGAVSDECCFGGSEVTDIPQRVACTAISDKIGWRLVVRVWGGKVDWLPLREVVIQG